MAYPDPIGVYWHTSDGTSVCHLLELPTPHGWSQPICCNLDGSIIYGNTNSGPARWDNGVLTLLASNPNVTSVVYCSQDGSVVTGIGSFSVTNYGYWTSGGTVSQGQLSPAAQFPGFLFGNPTRTISDDGSIIIGSTDGGVTYWTNGIATVIEPGGVNSCSKDGTMLVGIGPGIDNPRYWLSGTPVSLKSFDVILGFFNEARMCNGDKTRIYGRGTSSAPCYWDNLATTGPFGNGVIHLLTDPGFSDIFGVSDTNGVAIGNAAITGQEHALKWHDTSLTILPMLSEWTGCFATSVSADGSVVAGGSSEAFAASFWDASNTPFTLFVPPGLPDYASSATSGISKDGSTIFGKLFLPPPPPPIWIVTAPLNGESESGVGNLWIDESVVDFTDPSVLAGFVNSDGSWIDVGYYGQIPTGTSPLNYLTVQTGNTPNDFVFGYGQTGSQSSWQVSTTGVDPTTGEPYSADLVVDDCVAPGIPVTGVAAVSAVTAPTVFVSTSLMLTDLSINVPPIAEMATLRWSDDAGASWSNGLLKSIGRVGDYFTTPTWYRLGMSRNRIIELSWSSARPEALQGVFLRVEIAAT